MRSSALATLLFVVAACSSDSALDPDGGSDDAPSDGPTAAPGDIDTSYGTAGQLDFDSAVQLAVQRGNDVLVATQSGGFVVDSDGQIQAEGDVSYRAYDLDATSDGYVALIQGSSSTELRRYGAHLEYVASNIAPSLLTDFRVADLAVDPSGRFVLAGSNASNKVIVRRLDATGQLDSNFGTGGTVEIGSAEHSLSGRQVTVASDGSLWIRCDAGFQPCVIHLDAAGAPVAGFGVGGVLVLDQLGPRYGRDLVVDATGVATLLGMVNDSVQLARISASGEVLGVSTAMIDLPFEETVEARKLLADGAGGHYVSATYTKRESGSFSEDEAKGWLLHLDASGQPVPGFGDGTKLVIDFNRDNDPELVITGASTMIASGDRILVGGVLRNPSGVIRQSGAIVAIRR